MPTEHCRALEFVYHILYHTLANVAVLDIKNADGA